MSAPQIHPEDLLDRSRAGSLSAGEQRLLQKHLAHCSACRFELSLAPALYAHVDLSEDDDALLARAIARTRPVRLYARRGGAKTWAVRAAISVAATLGFAAIASAGAYAWRHHAVAVEARVLSYRTSDTAPTERGARTSPHRAVDPAGREGSGAADGPIALEAQSSSVEHEEGAVDAPDSAERARPSEPRRRHDDRRPMLGQPLSSLCAFRFHRAGEVRRAGASEEAVRLYQELLPACAGTSEELSARVLVGRIYLDRIGDPIRALASFDSYLSATSNGPLREDAMIGRALALGKLDRANDESNAWQALLAAYPDSLYAEKARARLKKPR